MSANQSKQTKTAVETQKVRKAMAFGVKNIRNLDAITVDKTIAKLLTSVNGEISVSLTGKNANVSVRVEEANKEVSYVDLDEFLRVLSAPAFVRSAVKKKQQQMNEDDLRSLVTHIFECFKEDGVDSVPITTESFGLVKQSLSLYKTSRRNWEVSELLSEKFPDDPLGAYLVKSTFLTTQIVAKGIYSLISGAKTVSESNTDELGELKLPTWSFNKFVKDNLDKNSSPYAVFFPRKKEKGIRVTTREIRDQTFVELNKELLARSRPLIKMLTDNSFLNLLFPLDEYTNEDAGASTFEKQGWNVFPLLEESIDRFLEVKEKAVTDVVAGDPQGNLKKYLEMANNAFLRTAQLENAGSNPAKLLCDFLAPNSRQDFTPRFGTSFYNLLRNDLADITDNFHDLFYMESNDAARLWAEMFCIEFHCSNSDQIRAAFVGACGFVAIQYCEDNNLLVGDDYVSAVDPKQPGDRRMGLNINFIFEGDPLLDPDTNLEINFEDGFEDILKDSTIREGHPNFPAFLTEKMRIFSILERDQEMDAKKAREPASANSISKDGHSLLRYMKREFKDAELTGRIRAYLNGFSSRRLQAEALKRVKGALDSSKEYFISDDNDDASDDGSADFGEGMFDNL